MSQAGTVMEEIPSSSKIKSKKTHSFSAEAFLHSGGVARKVVEYRRSEKIYSQGDPATSVLYIQDGGVKLSVVNEVGKEAVVAILGPGDFFGEGCLAGQSVRMGMAIAITSATLLVIEKKEMIRVLHAEHAFSDRFLSHMLVRNIRFEEDLVDQLFNSCEKRLARTLLLLAQYGKQKQPQKMLTNVSQGMLAEMIAQPPLEAISFLPKSGKWGSINKIAASRLNVPF